MQSANEEKQAKEPELGQPESKFNILLDVVFAAVLSVIFFVAASKLDLFEKAFDSSRKHETWEIDEFLAVGIFIMFYFMVLAFRKWRQSVEANQRLRQMNQELRQADNEIQRLRGIIPICAKCKNIRDDRGYWRKVEEYIRDRADVKFTHGLCPECFAILYPDVAAARQEKLQQAAEGESSADS